MTKNKTKNTNSLPKKRLLPIKQTSLRTKAIAFAMAISILPVLGVGIAAYDLVNQSTVEQSNSTQNNNAFVQQRQLLLVLEMGTLLTALIVGVSAVLITNRLVQPIIAATAAVKKMGEGNLETRVAIQGDDELAALGSHINQMADQLQELLEKQTAEAERLKLFTNFLSGSLNLENVYNLAVEEIRKTLQADRTVIYKFDENSQGSIIAESVLPNWSEARKVSINDPCLSNYVQRYPKGNVVAINNIYEVGLSECYLQQLESLEVKANLVVPILVGEHVVGLLIAHQCSQPRRWLKSEISLFEQFATIVGLALERANLLQQTQEALSQAERFSEEQSQHEKHLQLQLLQVIECIEGVSRGDLTVRAEVTSGEVGIVADFFNVIVESLREIVMQVKSASTQVGHAISDHSGAINQVADEAFKQAQQINSTLDSVDQMTHSTTTVANKAKQAAVIAHNASQSAEAGCEAIDLTVENIIRLRDTMAETTKKVKRLGESSQHISRVIALINQIALQTNLLAINAGIEAGRAGQDGQGFVVIAEEVAVLAAQSTSATSEIEEIIANIQLETNEVVKAMEIGTTHVVQGTYQVQNTKQSLIQILDVSRQIDELVQSISTATVSQVQTSKEVSYLVKEIAKVSEITSSLSRQVSAALHQTVEISEKLQASVGTFKVD
ncbi:methyl-accepting chemotaxis protein [Aetokthonos hydrillicola Thurmond2011]|uniref:Methyl-accepting chemotaxis protein n=1 Tax=Aetokthonos hydrillicola Thurmond2011 TaxID=2712845 RepID=A0AAP5I5C0_9CYAN|nr:methyl-accepting chemotaxis protein [Aetokthonos hydrillicola Thurmond2011]